LTSLTKKIKSNGQQVEQATAESEVASLTPSLADEVVHEVEHRAGHET
jgi:hypothetical protein